MSLIDVTDLNTLNASFTAEQTARINADSALTTSINALSASYGSDPGSMVPNPSAATDLAQWTGTGLVRVDTTDPSVPAGAPTPFCIKITARDTTAGRIVPCKAGDRFYLSGSIATPGSGASQSIYGLGLGIQFILANGTKTWATAKTRLPTDAPGTWAQSTGELVAPANAVSAQAWIQHGRPTGSFSDSYCWFVSQFEARPASTVNGVRADLSTEQTTRANADTALSQQITALSATVGQNTADIQSEQQARASADSAQASATAALSAQLNPKSAGELTDSSDGSAGNWTTMVSAGYYTTSLAQVSGDLALSQRVDNFTVSLASLQAQVTDETTARVTADQATASRITNVEVTAGQASSNAQVAINTAASTDGRVSSSISLKTQVAANGQRYFAGLMVGVDGSGGDVTSMVLVNAGTFAVLDASNGSMPAQYPFVITGGQTFIASAFIADASITSAKIANTIQSTAVDSTGNPLWKLDKTAGLTIRGSDGSGRTEVEGAGMRVYDASSVLRVRVGRW